MLINALSYFTTENTVNIHVAENLATFKLPENLHNNRSLQLIWSKDDNTQCVCPPVAQFMAICACNIDNTNNAITIFNNSTITISNLVQERGEGEVTLYCVSSVSSGCHDTCNLRSVAGMYRIIITQGT